MFKGKTVESLAHTAECVISAILIERSFFFFGTIIERYLIHKGISNVNTQKENCLNSIKCAKPKVFKV